MISSSQSAGLECSETERLIPARTSPSVTENSNRGKSASRSATSVVFAAYVPDTDCSRVAVADAECPVRDGVVLTVAESETVTDVVGDTEGVVLTVAESETVTDVVGDAVGLGLEVEDAETVSVPVVVAVVLGDEEVEYVAVSEPVVVALTLEEREVEEVDVFEVVVVVERSDGDVDTDTVVEGVRDADVVVLVE